MIVSIESVLELSDFSGVKLIAGGEKIQNQVKKVFLAEDFEVKPQYDEESLVLVNFRPSEESWRTKIDQFKKLCVNGLAGIGIRIEDKDSSIPEEIVEQAIKFDLPLLELPHQTDLSSMVNNVLVALLRKNKKNLKFRETVSQKLHHLLLEGAEITDVVDVLSDLTNMSVIVFDKSLQNIGHSRDLEGAPSFEKDKHGNVESEMVIAANHRQYRNDDYFLHSIKAGRRVLGYLVFLLPPSKQLTEELKVIAEQAIIFLAYQLQTKEILIQKERNYVDGFIRNILNGKFSSQLEMMEKAKVFRWNLYFPNVVLMMKINETESEKRITDYYTILDSGKIPLIISEGLDIPRENVKVTFFNDGLLCFISLSNEKRLEERLDLIGNRLIKSFESYGKIAVGISETIYSINEIKMAYQQVLLIHQVSKGAFSKKSYVQMYSKLGLYKLFYLVKEREKLEEFMKEQIGEVIQYDEKRDIKLLETLFYFIKNNGNLQKTAEETHIHYNSLRYRVTKLKELGLELEDGFKTAEIAVALQLYSYLNGEEIK